MTATVWTSKRIVFFEELSDFERNERHVFSCLALLLSSKLKDAEFQLPAQSAKGKTYPSVEIYRNVVLIVAAKFTLLDSGASVQRMMYVT